MEQLQHCSSLGISLCDSNIWFCSLYTKQKQEKKISMQVRNIQNHIEIQTQSRIKRKYTWYIGSKLL